MLLSHLHNLIPGATMLRLTATLATISTASAWNDIAGALTYKGDTSLPDVDAAAESALRAQGGGRSIAELRAHLTAAHVPQAPPMCSKAALAAGSQARRRTGGTMPPQPTWSTGKIAALHSKGRHRHVADDLPLPQLFSAVPPHSHDDNLALGCHRHPRRGDCREV